MRELTAHRVTEADNHISIQVLDGPGPGNANHVYAMYLLGPDGSVSKHSATLCFQNGPISEVGMNGITIEALLAVCKDRLDGFQSGPFACDSNQVALDAINNALDALHSRTRERRERGVEGKLQK